MKIKVSNTTNTQLDWLVAKAHYTDGRYIGFGFGFCFVGNSPERHDITHRFEPTTDWSQGGPILTEARISRTIDHSGLWVAYWTDGYGDEDMYKLGMQCDRSELVAGLRCYVARRLGDVVEVPDDLA